MLRGCHGRIGAGEAEPFLLQWRPKRRHVFKQQPPQLQGSGGGDVHAAVLTATIDRFTQQFPAGSAVITRWKPQSAA